MTRGELLLFSPHRPPQILPAQVLVGGTQFKHNDIIPAEYDRLSGSSAYYGTARVRVEKV